MANPYAPSSQAAISARSAPSLTRLYLVASAVGRVTLSTTGPSTFGLAQNAAGRWGPTDTPGTQRLGITDAERLLDF